MNFWDNPRETESNMFKNVTQFNLTSSSVVTYYLASFYLTNAFLVGTTLNILVIYYYSRDKILRKPSNYFFINLALSDLLMLVTTIPMNLISNFERKWLFGRIGKFK